MNVPVISAATAQQLNRSVQEKIDPHLFLFCNYEPTLSYAISEDAQFLTAIQDLYKFAIDSSCILRYHYKYVQPKDQRRSRQLSKLIDQIKADRAVIDHNQSPDNGRVEQSLLQTYAAWIRSVLGKAEPTTLHDFAALNAKLAQMGSELVKLTNDWIRCIGREADTDKAKIAEKWAKRTLQWYCSNSKTEIYMGQLMDAYLARATAAGHSIDISDRQLRAKVRNWIEYACFFPLDETIKQLEDDITILEEILQNTRMSADQQQALRREVTTYQQQLAAKKQEKVDLQTEINGNPVEYFYRGLEARLRNTISALEADQASYTLLPQDLLQEDIQLFFGRVPSPEGDF